MKGPFDSQKGCDPRVENCCCVLIISSIMNSSVIAVGMSYYSNNERVLKLSEAQEEVGP